MSRTNENKLKMKDIATIGIFSALLFVVTMVAGALIVCIPLRLLLFYLRRFIC